MYRTLADIEGRYVVVPPEEGVSLAEIHNVPYPAPDYAVLEDGSRIPRIVVRPWSDEYQDTPANAGGFTPADMRPLTPMPVASPDVAPPAGISFADWVRTISPVADSEGWREDNRVPFWIPDDPRAFSGGPSFDDVVRTIDTRANPDIWREDAPRYTGWDDTDRYAVPYDPRVAGAFVQAINPTADAAVRSESNVAPFWHIDDPYAPSAGVSFDDLVRTIPPTADPDIWPLDRSASLNAGPAWDGASASASERYAVPPDRTRAGVLGAFAIPGLPDDAAGWRLSEATPAGARISLAQRGRIIELLRAPAEAIRRALNKKASPTLGVPAPPSGQSSGSTSSGVHGSATSSPAQSPEPQHWDITRSGSRYPNKQTDFTRPQYEKYVQNKGFSSRPSKDGKVLNYENAAGEKYSFRDSAKSSDGPTVEHYTPGGGKPFKIRLKK